MLQHPNHTPSAFASTENVLKVSEYPLAATELVSGQDSGGPGEMNSAAGRPAAPKLPVQGYYVRTTRSLSKIFKQWVLLVSKDHWKQYSRAGMPI